MENSQKQRNKARKARVMRIRKKVRGTAERPRLTVTKSNNHLYAQLIDDEAGVTLKGVGTLTQEHKSLGIVGDDTGSARMKAAKHLGAQIAGAAKSLNIDKIVFDRGRWKYHGVIKALADSVREAGLTF
jgi:large subunit ribosomal protein L18